MPANATVEATSATGAIFTYTATATDLVDGSVAVTCTPASGATFPLGPTTVSCTRDRRARQQRSGVLHRDGSRHDEPGGDRAGECDGRGDERDRRDLHLHRDRH